VDQSCVLRQWRGCYGADVFCALQLRIILDRAVGPHLDVRGLQIAVHDSLVVRRFERDGNLTSASVGPSTSSSTSAMTACPDPACPERADDLIRPQTRSGR